MPIKRNTSHRDMPASVGLVKEVRSELLAEIRSVRHELGLVHNEVGSVRHELSSRMDKMDSRIESVLAGIHKTQVLMEEQRSENRVVLDGLKSVTDRQDNAEKQAEYFHQTLKMLVKVAENRSIER
jgi:septation ring formation regulator EzrA